MRGSGYEQVSENLRWIVCGLNTLAKKYKGCFINGFRFHSKKVERIRKIQNSGVVLQTKTSSFASARDRNPINGNVTYYGVLRDIIQLDCYEHGSAMIFKCDWIDYRGRERGMKTDEYGFTLVNLDRCVSDDPFILASQIEQVLYVPDPTDRGCYVVRKAKSRDLFDMQSQNDGDDVSSNSNIEAPLTADLAELDLLIGQTEDDDEGNLITYEDYDDQSEGVQDDFESDEEDEIDDS